MLNVELPRGLFVRPLACRKGVSLIQHSTFNIQHSTFNIQIKNNRYKTNKKWKKDCTVLPMNTMRVA